MDRFENRSRLLLDAAKFELKKGETEKAIEN